MAWSVGSSSLFARSLVVQMQREVSLWAKPKPKPGMFAAFASAKRVKFVPYSPIRIKPTIALFVGFYTGGYLGQNYDIPLVSDHVERGKQKMSQIEPDYVKDRAKHHARQTWDRVPSKSEVADRVCEMKRNIKKKYPSYEYDEVECGHKAPSSRSGWW